MKKKISIIIFALIVACTALLFSSCGETGNKDAVETELPDLTYTLLDDGTYSVLIGASDSAEIKIPSEYNNRAVTQIDGRMNGSEQMFCVILNQSLKSVEIPDSIISISPSAFVGCAKLENINVVEGNNLYNSKDGILYSKDDTTLICYPVARPSAEFAIPDGVTSIGNSAFSGCDSLTSVTIPESVTSIGEGAFKSCKKIESILISESVTEIGDFAFAGCDDIKIYSEATQKPNGWSKNIFNFNSNSLSGSSGAVYWYSESKPEYKFQSGQFGVLGDTNYWLQNNYWHYVDGEITIWEY